MKDNLLLIKEKDTVLLRILVSNDDGVSAPGIRALSEALRRTYHVQVVAPDRNRSGASNALTLDRPLRTVIHENGDIALVEGPDTGACFRFGLPT